MPIITFTALEEGDQFNASSLNTQFTSVTATINDLATSSVGEGALNTRHLPSMELSGVGGANLTTSINPAGGAACEYNDTVFAYPTFNMLDSNGNTAGGTNVQVSFAPATVTLGAAGTQGILVLGNILLQQIGQVGFAAAVPNRFAVARVAIVEEPGAVVTPILRSERFVQEREGFVAMTPVTRPQMVDLPLRVLIRASDMTGGRTTISGVRFQVSPHDPTGGPAFIFRVMNARLTVIPLRADLS